MPAPQALRILIAHNYYQQAGGEDGVARAEYDLLTARGHPVEIFSRHNDELSDIGKARAASETIWSRETVRRFADIAAVFKPDILHVHNTLPLISPSIYWAASDRGVAVVQTLHNYRLVCPQASFLRGGQLCEDCLGRLPWPGVLHGCYRSSRAQTAVIATMLGVHRALGTYNRKVHRYIALTRFARDKMLEGGLPADRVAVKPNFVADPGPSDAAPRSGGLFVGRLSEEKGLATLIAATREQPMPIRVVGTGPLAANVRAAFGTATTGALAEAEVRREMQRASFLVVPSIWYEGFPRVIVEAFANGLPVIASRLGSLADIIEDGKTGLFVPPGDAAALRQALQWAVDHPAKMASMGEAARQTYVERFGEETNYRELLEIYAAARRQMDSAGVS